MISAMTQPATAASLRHRRLSRGAFRPLQSPPPAAAFIALDAAAARPLPLSRLLTRRAIHRPHAQVLALLWVTLGCSRSSPAAPGATGETGGEQAATPIVSAEPQQALPALTPGPASASAELLAARRRALRTALVALEPTLVAPVAAGSLGRVSFDAGRWADAARGLGQTRALGLPAGDDRRAFWMELVARSRAGEAAQAAAALETEARAALTPAAGDEEAAALCPSLALWASDAWLAAGEPARAAQLLADIEAAGGAKLVGKAMWSLRIARARAKSPDADAASIAAAYRAAVSADPSPDPALLAEAAKAMAASGSEGEASALWRRIRVLHPGTQADSQAAVALAARPAEERELTLPDAVARLERLRASYQHEAAMAEAAALRPRLDRGGDLWCQATEVQARATEIFWLKRKEAAGLYGEAIEACTAWSGRSGLLWRAGQRYHGSGFGAKAIATFSALEAIDGKATIVDDAMRARARALSEAGRGAEADAVLRAVVAAGGDMAEYAAFDLVRARAEAGDWKGLLATADAISAAKIDAEHAYNRGRLRYFAALAAERLGDKAAAIEGYSQTYALAGVAYYGWLALGRLTGLDKRRATAAQEALLRRPPVAAPLPSPALQEDRQLLRALWLERMGMHTSARDALDQVSFRGCADLPSGTPAAARAAADSAIKAQIFHLFGETSRAMAAAEASERAPDGDHRLWPPLPTTRVLATLAQPLPADLLPAIEAATAGGQIDLAFALAIMRTESRFNPRAESPVHARGLLQLMLPTAKAMNDHLKLRPSLEPADLYQPAINIPLGVGYQKRLHGQLGGHLALVASAYNAGPGNTGKWLAVRGNWSLDLFVEAIPFKENRRYVKNVLTTWMRYRLLLGEPIPLPRFQLDGKRLRPVDDSVADPATASASGVAAPGPPPAVPAARPATATPPKASARSLPAKVAIKQDRSAAKTPASKRTSSEKRRR